MPADGLAIWRILKPYVRYLVADVPKIFALKHGAFIRHWGPQRVDKRSRVQLHIDWNRLLAPLRFGSLWEPRRLADHSNQDLGFSPTLQVIRRRNCWSSWVPLLSRTRAFLSPMGRQHPAGASSCPLKAGALAWLKPTLGGRIPVSMVKFGARLVVHVL